MIAEGEDQQGSAEVEGDVMKARPTEVASEVLEETSRQKSSQRAEAESSSLVRSGEATSGGR